jgi:hypothetical protein
MAEDTAVAQELLGLVAERYRSHNLNAIEIGGEISRLQSEHGMTLDRIRGWLRENHNIAIHSNGTLSKWRGVYDTYVLKWGLTVDEISRHEISKLYMIKDSFEPSTADMWFERMNTMTEGELMEEVGNQNAESRKHFSVPLSVAGMMERARAALSEDALGKSDALSTTAYQEIVAQLILDIGPERRREFYEVLHGENRVE